MEFILFWEIQNLWEHNKIRVIKKKGKENSVLKSRYTLKNIMF